MRALRLRRQGALLIAVFAACALVIAGCGDDADDGTTSATTSSVATTTTNAGATGGGESGDANGKNGNGDAGGDRGSTGTDQGSTGTDRGSDGGDGTNGNGSSVDQSFATDLRSIVGDSLTQLAPLAQVAAANGDPKAYATMLETASGQIDDTISQLEALDPPSAAADGTQQVIDAYRDLGDAVSRGADDFGSGDPSRIQSALGYLTKAASNFRTQLADATKSLSNAGFGLPGT